MLLTFKEKRDVATAVQEILIRRLLLQRTDSLSAYGAKLTRRRA